MAAAWKNLKTAMKEKRTGKKGGCVSQSAKVFTNRAQRVCSI